jgi:cytochrome c-type biogenesis protein CcmH
MDTQTLFWIAAAVLLASAVVPLMLAVLRGRGEMVSAAEHDIAVFKAQLQEVDNDIQRGVITETEAAQARLEIKRRILAADKQHSRATTQMGQRGRRILAGGLAVGTVAAAGLVYADLGHPGMSDQPYEVRQALLASQKQDAMARVKSILAQVRRNPSDLSLWVQLARAQMEAGHVAQFHKTMGMAEKVGRDFPPFYAEWGALLTALDNGRITSAALDKFLYALKLDPTEARARYYLGMAMYQQDKPQDAMAILRFTLAEGATDAPWRQMVQDSLNNIAAEIGMAVADVAPKDPLAYTDYKALLAAVKNPAEPPADGGASPMATQAGGFTADQQEMIAGMVSGLAERMQDDPDNAEGWRRLGIAYRTLRQFDKARHAYANLARLEPQNPQVLLQWADAVRLDEETANPGSEQGVLESAKIFDKLLALNPDHPVALYVTGLAAALEGRNADAIARWEHLLKLIPKENATYKEVFARLQDVKARQ